MTEKSDGKTEKVSRRKIITTGLATVAGVSGLMVAAKIADRYGLLAPDHGGILGAGEALTYGAMRVLTAHHSMAREFNRSEISKIHPVNGLHPKSEAYQRMANGNFQDYRLTVDGLVARPASFSLDELKRMPSRTDITHQACEEGWSFIAEWTGVPLSYVLNYVGTQPHAKWAVFHTFQTDWWDSLDMPEVLHPQTLVAYNMNGDDIPLDYGAPVRLRVPRQLGYKSLKFLTTITITDSLKNVGDGQGSPSPAAGYSWYAGI